MQKCLPVLEGGLFVLNVSLRSLTDVSLVLTVLLLKFKTAPTERDKQACWENSHWFMNIATNRKTAIKTWLSLSVLAMMLFRSRTVRVKETTVKDLKETFYDKKASLHNRKTLWNFSFMRF